MSGVSFLDTNLLVYAHDSSDRRKQEIAQRVLVNALEGAGVISSQVITEFAATLVHKLTPRPGTQAIKEMLFTLHPIKVVDTDTPLVARAVEAHGRYGIHFYDGLIVAAAERAGCSRIWSEDMNAGQKYFGIAVENPFA